MNIKTAPLWQWILMVVVSFVLAVFAYGFIVVSGEILQAPWVRVVCSLVVIALYVFFVRWFEKEWARDILQLRGAADLLLGLAVGVVFFVLVVALMLLFGCCTVEKLGFDWPRQLSALCMFFGVAVGEEVIFRGILFRWIDRRWGLTAALIVSALIFGLIHITNDNATLWGAIAIAVEAGLLLGAAYKWSGTLWLPIGIHWAWNYAQGNIFGFAVSGNDAGSSFLRVVADGPDLLTGGAFGAEASLLSVLLGLAFAALFLWLHLRKKGVN